MCCRVVHKTNRVSVKDPSALVAKTNQCIHHEVGGLDVSEAVGKQVQIGEDIKALVNVLEVLSSRACYFLVDPSELRLGTEEGVWWEFLVVTAIIVIILGRISV